jgi:hypothetical protein
VLYPTGGEEVTVGDVIRIRWDASDDISLLSQKVEFSADGATFSTIGILDAKSRTYDWRIPSVATSQAKIRVTVLDGVNLPVSATSANSFRIVHGPPDLVAPKVQMVLPDNDTVVGGGMSMVIKWKESDNIGVIRRLVELSTDGGDSFTEITTLMYPSSGEIQSFEWQIPVTLSSVKAKVRVTVFDGSDNPASAISIGKFDIWPMPIITGVEYKVGVNGEKDEIELSGRFFRSGETEIYAGGQLLKKVKYEDKYYTGDGMSRKVSSFDKKLSKRFPRKQDIAITVRLPKTAQISPPFVFRRVSE